MENNSIIQELLSKVKSNKKYSSISDEIVLNEINSYLKKNQIKDLSNISKSDISEIRKSLHRLYSSYQTKHKNKIQDYLNELDTNSLLSTTLSTKERLQDYEDLYKKIFNITGKPKIITDLGSGFNVFSFPFMNLNELTYYSYDINEKDIDYLNQYYEIMKSRGLRGKAEILNSQNLEKIRNIPKSEIIFMFKLIDLIDKKHKKTSEELINYLLKNNKTKFIVASFATATLTRKPMNLPKRKGFELMLERIGLKFQTIKTKNEIFYIINN